MLALVLASSKTIGYWTCFDSLDDDQDLGDGFQWGPEGLRHLTTTGVVWLLITPWKVIELLLPLLSFISNQWLMTEQKMKSQSLDVHDSLGISDSVRFVMFADVPVEPVTPSGSDFDCSDGFLSWPVPWVICSYSKIWILTVLKGGKLNYYDSTAMIHCSECISENVNDWTSFCPDEWNWWLTLVVVSRMLLSRHFEAAVMKHTHGGGR